MSLVTLLQPDLILGGPVTLITPAILNHYSLQGLILDVDETLVPWDHSDVSLELTEWLREIKQSTTSLWLVSNNLSEERIGNIAKSLDLPYLLGAGKPSRRKLKLAIEQMNLPSESVAMVGDRLFTDVLAGNRLGLFTILVEPILGDSQIRSWTHVIRHLEICLSQKLGVSFTPQHNFTELNKYTKK